MSETLELIRQIVSLTGRIERLEARLEERLAGEKKIPLEEEFKLWKPKLNDNYYFNKPDGTLSSRRYEGNDYDEAVIAEYGAYPDNDVADEEANWLRAARKLRALARELGDGSINEDYFVICRRPDDTLYIDEIYSKHSVSEVARFKTREAAQTALDNLTEDEREALFGN